MNSGDAGSVNAFVKLDEARFCLNLMGRLEAGRLSLTEGREPVIEFGYLLSGFLNACYSCTEHLKRNIANSQTVKRFHGTHSAFYGSGHNGGWRAQAVHFRPVNPGYDGYIPPPADKVMFRARKSVLLNEAEKTSSFTVGPGHETVNRTVN